MSEPEKSSTETKDWVYRDSTKRMLMMMLIAGCILSIVVELFVGERHAHFAIDAHFGFFAALGFGACTVMIFLAKLLGLILKVPTNFYGDDDEEDTPS